MDFCEDESGKEPTENPWLIYERIKRDLIGRSLPNEEYEAAIRELLRILEL